MEPTLRAGDSALVDHSRRELYNGIIFALNIEGGPIVKRVRRLQGGWLAESDNAAYGPLDVGEADTVIGRVVWWAHTEWRK